MCGYYGFTPFLTLHWLIVALLSARWTAICFPMSLLSLSENLHARIASGTVNLGKRNGPWGTTIFWPDNLPAKKPWQSPPVLYNI